MTTRQLQFPAAVGCVPLPVDQAPSCVNVKRASVLDCGSPLPLSDVARRAESARATVLGVAQFLRGWGWGLVNSWPLRLRTFSPSPCPSPSEGEGRRSTPARPSAGLVSSERRQPRSLSQRERAGVRENGPTFALNPRGVCPSITRRGAFSLIEIMVSVTLLALIVIGLIAVINHTQRALRIAHNQTDILEGARSTVEIVARDLSGLTASGDINTVNLFATNISALQFPRPGGGDQTNILQDFYVLTRENDTWTAIGYFIDLRGVGAGTLYRFSTNGYLGNTNFGALFYDWFSSFSTATVNDSHRVADGVVHFETRIYDQFGRLYVAPMPASNGTNDYWVANMGYSPDGYIFKGPCLPAYIDFELGLLEPQTARQFNAIAANNPAGGKAFLAQQIGKIHLFRQRIPVRNFSQPQTATLFPYYPYP